MKSKSVVKIQKLLETEHACKIWISNILIESFRRRTLNVVSDVIMTSKAFLIWVKLSFKKWNCLGIKLCGETHVNQIFMLKAQRICIVVSSVWSNFLKECAVYLYAQKHIFIYSHLFPLKGILEQTLSFRKQIKIFY